MRQRQLKMDRTLEHVERQKAYERKNRKGVSHYVFSGSGGNGMFKFSFKLPKVVDDVTFWDHDVGYIASQVEEAISNTIRPEHVKGRRHYYPKRRCLDCGVKAYVKDWVNHANKRQKVSR